MTITAEQVIARRRHVGSSDAAAILGLDPHRTAYDVWLSKTAELADDGGSEAMAIGNWLEPKLVEWASDQVGSPYRKSPPTVVGPCGIIAMNFDGLEDRDEPESFIEAKTTGLLEGWGEPGTDEVPERVLVQTHIGFAIVPSLRVAWVPVLLGDWGLKRRLYCVKRNDTLANEIAATCRDWWESHVVANVAPIGFPTLDVLKRVKREPASSVELGPDGVVAFDLLATATAERKEAETREEELKAAAIAMLGTAESATLPDGRVATYLETHRKGYAVKDTTFRTLRVKGPKKP